MAVNVVAITPDSTHTDAERFAGFSVQEDGGSTAAWEFRIGSATGTVIWYLKLAAGESASVIFPKPLFIISPGGVHVKEASGSATGSLFYVDQ